MLVCPHCGQSIRCERLGTPMPLVKSLIVDAIKLSGDIGITTDELVREVYRDRRRMPARETIKAHVFQINELLAGTDWVIRSEGDYGTSERRWHVRRRYVRRVA